MSATDASNLDLANIFKWSNQYGLTVNPGKSQAIIIDSPGMFARVKSLNLPAVLYNGIRLPYSGTVKDLLSWSVQIKEVSRKTFNALILSCCTGCQYSSWGRCNKGLGYPL